MSFASNTHCFTNTQQIHPFSHHSQSIGYISTRDLHSLQYPLQTRSTERAGRIEFHRQLLAPNDSRAVLLATRSSLTHFSSLLLCSQHPHVAVGRVTVLLYGYSRLFRPEGVYNTIAARCEAKDPTARGSLGFRMPSCHFTAKRQAQALLIACGSIPTANASTARMSLSASSYQQHKRLHPSSDDVNGPSVISCHPAEDTYTEPSSPQHGIVSN